MLSPRVRAITPITNPTLPQTPTPQNAELIDATQQSVLQNFNRTVETGISGAQGNSQLIDRIANNLAGISQAERFTQSIQGYRESNNTEQTVGAINNLVSSAFDMWTEVQKQRAARQQAADEEQLAKNRLEVEIRKQRILSTAESALRDPNIGFAGYQAAITRFIRENQGYVTDDDLVAVTAELYTPLRAVMSEEAQAFYGAFSEIYDREANITGQTVITQFSGQLGRLARMTDPEQAQQLANGIITEFNQYIANQGLSPLQILQVSETLLTQVRENYGTSTAVMAQMEQGLTQFQAYAEAFQTQVAPLQAAGDFAAASQVDQQLRIQYGITYDTPWTDHLFNTEQAQRGIRVREEMSNLVEGAVIDSRRVMEFDRAEVLTIALQMYQDPTTRAYWQVPGFAENPAIQQAIAISDALSGYSEWQGSTRPQEAALYNQQLLQYDEQIQRLQLQYIQGQGTDPSQLLQSLSILNPAMSGMAQYYQGQGRGEEFNRIMSDQQRLLQVIQGGQASPEQVRAAYTSLIENIQQQREALRLRFEASANEQEENMRILRQYGITSPEDFRAQAEAARVTYDSIIQEVNDAQQAARQNLITQPNFNLPALDTYTYGETTGIIPFRAGGLAEVGGAFRPDDHSFGASRDRGARRHAGMDFAVPVGTPIISYIQGTVEYVETLDGYGRTVVIRAPDNTYHLFGDVNDVNVQPGQAIYPGQQIALSGNSGNGSAHLHWQIMRSARGFHYNQSIDPLEYTSQMSRYVNPQRPTAVQQNQSRLTNTYAAADVQSYRRNGGLGNDGAGNFGYAELANDRTFRIRLHQVASDIGVPAQWLADIIAMETGGSFSPSIRNQAGSGATGLIQFYSDRGDGTKTIGGRTYRLSDLARMSRIQQLDVVRDYLVERRQYSPNGYQSIGDLMLAVWAGPSSQRRLQTDGPEALRNLNDGSIDFFGYYNRLGRHAGRRYAPLVGGGGGGGGGGTSPIHVRPRRGCPVCDQIGAVNFIQHEGQR